MTDREMLLLAYGAMKALVPDEARLRGVVELVEEHLYPQVDEVEMDTSDEAP